MTLIVASPRVEYGTVHGDVHVRDGGDLTLYGMIVGTLTVGLGGYAHVAGVVQGLVIRDAGQVVLDGMCTGNASNLGGQLTVRGMIVGSLSGPGHVDPGAVIGS